LDTLTDMLREIGLDVSFERPLVHQTATVIPYELVDIHVGDTATGEAAGFGADVAIKEVVERFREIATPATEITIYPSEGDGA
jgi:hypothetical protein